MYYGRVMLDIAGTSLTAEDKDLLMHPNVGGIILFSRNFTDVAQLTELVREIKLLRGNLLLAVDQEGGKVQRFQNEFTKLPALASIGALYDQDREAGLELAYQAGWLMAAEILAVGIDFSFAPVLDLNRGVSEVIGSRSLHSSSEAVIELATKYMLGMQSAGMVSVGKHFPGHGAVVADSHLSLPEDKRELVEIEQDVKPFAKLIEYGLDAIMPAHVLFSKLDDMPACFSGFWLEKYLRTKLGFTGAILSDDLSMQGAAIIGKHLTRAEVALQAGCDMVLVCNNRDAALEVVEGLALHDKADSSARLSKLTGNKVLTWAELHDSLKWLQAVESISKLVE